VYVCVLVCCVCVIYECAFRVGRSHGWGEVVVFDLPFPFLSSFFPLSFFFLSWVAKTHLDHWTISGWKDLLSWVLKQ